VTATVYLAYPVEVLASVGAVTGLGLGFLVTVVAFLLRRGVAVGVGWVCLLVGSFGVIATGLLDIWLLTHPDYRGGAYGDLFSTFERTGLPGVIERHGLDAILFVGYQLIGILLLMASFAVVFAACGGLVARVNVQLGARPAWLWRFLLVLERWWGRRPYVALLTGVLLAAGSAGLTSGAGYNLVVPDSALTFGGVGLRDVDVRLPSGGSQVAVSFRASEPGTVRLALARNVNSRWRPVRSRAREVDRGRVRISLAAGGARFLPGRYRLTVTIIADGEKDTAIRRFTVRAR
jgi:hypothetical protein